MGGTAERVISNLVNRTKGLNDIYDDIQTLDGIVDVPTKDSTADVQMSDVVGKKDDTAVDTVTTTKSLVAYLKGVLNLHDVPAKDATTDAHVRDIIGKKDDTAQTTVGTTRSLMAYLKGVLNSLVTIDGLLDVPSKDATADVYMREVVGKKDDTAQTTVATTKSVIAYTKGTLTQIADLITRTKGLNDIHDDLSKNASSETTGTYAHPSGVAEGTVKEITGTTRQELKSIWIDLATLTQDATLKVYHKIDASTYRQYATYNWVTTDEDGVMIDGVTINNDWKVTITSAIAEGASRNIPYNIIYEPLE